MNTIRKKKDNDDDDEDDDDGDDGEGGEGGEGGAGQVNLNQEVEQPVNTEGNTAPEVEADNVVPGVDKPAGVKDHDQVVNEESNAEVNVNVNEPEQLQDDTIVVTPEKESTATTKTPSKRKESESKMTVPSRPSSSKGIVIKEP
ncbi:hypothetical protein L1987_18756 [Smallanthus sonchifolius]|uniref:Uncharacterized protein n=1 Tax=Smallanthus sonchifolius TaxID=185202 RepID=A0ACB9J2K9_9ASTR|nr:hypothetical protein L1987_18756 [Smallanthus sonchifolius]